MADTISVGTFGPLSRHFWDDFRDLPSYRDTESENSSRELVEEQKGDLIDPLTMLRIKDRYQSERAIVRVELVGNE